MIKRTHRSFDAVLYSHNFTSLSHNEYIHMTEHMSKVPYFYFLQIPIFWPIISSMVLIVMSGMKTYKKSCLCTSTSRMFKLSLLKLNGTLSHKRRGNFLWNPEVSRSRTSARRRDETRENLWAYTLGPLNVPIQSEAVIEVSESKLRNLNNGF